MDGLSSFCGSGKHAVCHDPECPCEAAAFHGSRHAAEKIKITWTDTRAHEAVMTRDEARELFGLGGTEDESLIDRIMPLAAYDPALLRVLEDRRAETGSYGGKITKINGMLIGDLR